MKKALIMLCVATAGGLILSAGAGRVGGNAEIVYDRIGAGGAAYATDGSVKLGASLGQSGFMLITTNANGDVFLNGFWKAEDSCTLYNPSITDITQWTNGVAITFMVVNGNTYSVSYITGEQGGLPAGVTAITNPVQTVAGVGVPGATTTVWHNVSASTNVVRFYVIRCE